MATVEQKAKAYDEALERARKELQACGSSDCNAARQIFRFFPELSESKDERIRKNLIELLLDTPSQDIISHHLGLNEVLAWLEKQGEAKQKVKQKFEIGDLITNGILVGKIDEIHEWGYHAYFGDHYADVPDAENWHKWTIKDAKAGDILEFGDHGKLVVGIVSYVNKTTDKVDVNCLLENNNFKLGNYYALDTIKPHPATKGQCDTFFAKMKEAGYEWDAERKELKNIDQKPAWSEEDEKQLNDIIRLLPGLDIRHNWLKSLKQRIGG